MLGSYRVYDADAHVILAPAMWEDLPEKYVPRRPCPATFSDSGDMAAYTRGGLIEGRVEPHILGPGLQPANTPAWVVEGRHRDTHTLMNPEGRVRELDEMGIDVQFLFPSTLYARMTADLVSKLRCCGPIIDLWAGSVESTPSASSGPAWSRCVSRVNPSQLWRR